MHRFWDISANRSQRPKFTFWPWKWPLEWLHTIYILGQYWYHANEATWCKKIGQHFSYYMHEYIHFSISSSSIPEHASLLKSINSQKYLECPRIHLMLIIRIIFSSPPPPPPSSAIAPWCNPLVCAVGNLLSGAFGRMFSGTPTFFTDQDYQADVCKQKYL